MEEGLGAQTQISSSVPNFALALVTRASPHILPVTPASSHHLLLSSSTPLSNFPSRAMSSRYCVLYTSARMLYFDDQQCDVCRGAVDLSIASSVVGVDVPTGVMALRLPPPIASGSSLRVLETRTSLSSGLRRSRRSSAT